MRSACFALLAAVASAQEIPGDAEQRAFIAQMRQWAMKYNETLPNFICTQVTNRSVDYTGAGDNWEPLDKIEQQLSYFDRREIYKLLALNGKPLGPKNKLKNGVTSNGEFGSMLNQVFDPWIGTAFAWQRSDTLRNRAVWVFSLHVEQSRSRATIAIGNHSVVAGYHGFVFADRETKKVMRLIVDAESPKDFPMQDISHVLDYGQVPLAGAEYTLPVHSEVYTKVPESFMRGNVKRLYGRRVLTRNEVDFVQYRKYAAEASISFDSDDPKKK